MKILLEIPLIFLVIIAAQISISNQPFTAVHIPAAAVGARDRLFFAVFTIREEYVETLIAFVTDKVIGGHAPILTESGLGMERHELIVKVWVAMQIQLI
jgi:hypothetical protein